MSVAVVTPSLNKSFKFQSDWPYNNSQVYLLNSVLDDLKEDEERKFESTNDGFVFTSKVNYPNNKVLVKQNVYLDKDSKVTRVEVIDKDDNVLISMDYKVLEYDKKFDDDYFELGSIINVSDKLKQDKKKNDNSSSINNSNQNNSDNNNQANDNNPNNNDSLNNNSNETTGNNNSQNSNNGNNDGNSGNASNSENEKTKETLSINDIIYPMYLPENTYLTSQERIDTETGERLILTFSGENSFVLVEETVADSDSNLIIPVTGEFDFLSDVIGVISDNSVMWYSNGIEHYLTSNTIETSMLVDIARSISVLPVSK